MTDPASASAIVLHGYFRSSASWRVRIALALKGLGYGQQTYRLRMDEQRSESFLALNPQGLVPALEIDGAVLTQSLAICEYLDETVPEPPLLGETALARAKIRAFAQVIACDTHPLQNLKVLAKLRSLGLDEQAANGWARDVVSDGLAVCARLLPDPGSNFCFGQRATLADICLIPQMANARRFGVDMVWPELERIERHCLALPAFRDTAPSNQPDAV